MKELDLETVHELSIKQTGYPSYITWIIQILGLI